MQSGNEHYTFMLAVSVPMSEQNYSVYVLLPCQVLASCLPEAAFSIELSNLPHKFYQYSTRKKSVNRHQEPKNGQNEVL